MISAPKFYPLTNAQKSIWNIVKFYPNTTFINVASTVRIRECVDYEVLNRAINLAIKENDAMRMRIVENGKEPEQYFPEYREQQFEFLDFSYSDSAEDLDQWEKTRCREKIELLDSNLYDFVILKIGNHEGAFFINIHHIAADAWSITILIRQILQNYRKLRNDEEGISEERPSYKDYIQTENEAYSSERFQKRKGFWNELFSTVPDFTTINTNKVQNQTTAERKTCVLPHNISLLIKDYSSGQNVSPFCILFSVLTIYIWKLTGKTDIVIGTPVLNRSGVKEKSTMGMFVNSIPFRIKLNIDLDFESFVKSVNQHWKTLLKHHKYPYDLILKNFREIHGISEKIYDVMMSFQNATFEVYDIDYTAKWLYNGSELNSLTIHINDREGVGNYTIDYDYLTDVLSEAEIRQIHQCLSTLLDQTLSNPYLKLTDFKMISSKQEHDLLWKFNNTKQDYPQEETIVTLFEKQVRFAPEKVAIIFENKTVTYQELNNRSNQLAKHLRSNGGVEKDSIVGLLIDRSVELIVAILAVLKAGGAYLPIDPTYPAERIDYMLNDSNCQLLLCYTINYNPNLTFKARIVDIMDQRLYKENTTNLEDVPMPNDLAYVIYTSGSTGTPKGVMIEHKSLNNLVHAFSDILKGDKTVLSIATVSFDIFFKETIYPLLKGMRVILTNQQEATVPYLLHELLNRHKVNFMQATPSRMKLILNVSDAERLPYLTEIIIGGESFPQQLLSEIKNVTNARIFNCYGPTETTICASIKNLTEEEPITIGKPLANTQIYILDENLEPVPIGVTGEIFISGDGLARGYINNEGLTRERFTMNPFIPGSRMYKTGDIARWQSNGEIEYLGRNDHQVKIRGFRIELGEIETCLLKHDLVKEAVVLCIEDNSHKNYLCAYLTIRGKVSSSDFRDYLSSLLPDYMIPGHFVVLESLPLTPNGKLNRKALPKPDIRGNREHTYAAPRNALEQKLAKLWEDALEITNVGIDDNFFALGGDSLAVLEVLSGLFPNDWSLSAQDFYDYATIRKLADKILDSGMSAAPSQKDEQAFTTISSVPQCRLPNISTGNILLTGATGFLGIHILYELLNTTKDKIYCLIRGNNPEKRLDQLLKYYFPFLSRSQLNDRLMVINGDVSLENFGLSSPDMRALSQAVTRVIHAAAIVSHYGEYNEFYRINVQGTQEVVNFCQENGLKLNHISTISISGNYMIYDHELRKFTEHDFYIGQEPRANIYVRTKFEAEDLILKALDQGLNATIFRVGVLTGRYSDGKFQTNIGQNAFYRQLKAILMLEAIPYDFLQEQLEYTPVDYCAKAIVQLTQSSNSSMPVFHVFNHKSINVGEMLQHFEASGISIKTVSQESFNSLLVSISTSNFGKEVLSGIISNLNINDSLGFVSNIQVDSSETIKYLGDIGFVWPDIDGEYLAKVLNHMQVTGFIEKVLQA